MSTQASAPLLPALFGGERRAAESGETLEAINPATGEVIGFVPRCRQPDVAIAVAAARAAFPSWRSTHPEERAERLRALAAAIEADRRRLVDLEVADNGSPRWTLDHDVDIAVRYLHYFAGLALQVRGETVPGAYDRLNYTLREPFGVVARILPFNHPLMFAVARLAAPLLCGNTLILKPSEVTSLSTLALGEHLERIFPRGVASVVTGFGAEAGDALVAHPDIRRIAFIGSVETGLAIQRRAAERTVKTVTLELGGKSPLVVFPDAAFESALDAAVEGMRLNLQGQACGATTRVLVQRGLYARFVEAFADRLEEVRVGPPDEPEAQVGAIVSEQQLKRVLEYIEIGVAEGGRIRAGGERLSGDPYSGGCFVSPTLLSDVPPTGRLAQEEVFGPVVAAMPFDSYADAVELANGVRFGLTAGVHTRDLAVAHAFARDVEAGYVWVNENQRHFPGTGYGGVKDSGVGREEDLQELASYTQTKNIHVAFGEPLGRL